MAGGRGRVAGDPPGDRAVGAASAPRGHRAVGSAVVLLGAGAGYGGGNVGPATDAISGAFGISLSTVGLMMTVFFAAIVAVTFASATVVRRLGPHTAIVWCCVLSGLGNALCTVSPWYIGVLAGRVVAGLGAGLAFVIGPVVARASGGPKLIGAFGASVTLGVAVALAVGSVVADAGANWRVGFGISMAVGLSALAVLPRRLSGAGAPGSRSSGFLSHALRRPALWRLMLLFIAANGITIVVSTWLIEYLVAHGSNHRWYAGVLGFVLFAVTAAVRQLSGRFATAGPGGQRLAALSPLLTAAGLTGLALNAHAGPALLWVVMTGAGFALPYALVIERAQRLFPQNPAEVIAFLQTGPNIVPMIVVPIIGAALDAGNGPAAWLAIAVFLVLAALANAGRPTADLEPARPSATSSLAAEPGD